MIWTWQTNGTVTLDVETGALRWHYSHHILAHWDLDWAIERHIIDITVNGKPRHVVATVSKGALLDTLDAATGEYLFSVEMGNLDPSLKAFDGDTGEIVWQTTLTDDPSSSIVTYAVAGKQYLALVRSFSRRV